MVKIFRLINNPRCTYYIIIFYLAVSIVFSLLYYSVIPAIEGTPSLQFHNRSEAYITHYFDCFYYSITSQTTVGYGDITPVTFLSKTVTTVQVTFGYFYLAFTIAFFTAKAILNSDKFEAILCRLKDDNTLH